MAIEGLSMGWRTFGGPLLGPLYRLGSCLKNDKQLCFSICFHTWIAGVRSSTIGSVPRSRLSQVEANPKLR